VSYKIPVTLRVPIDSTWKAGTTLQAYTDAGDGSVDTGAPLLPRRVDVFPQRFPAGGYGRGGYGKGAYGSDNPSVKSAGYGRGGYGQGAYGQTGASVTFTVYIEPNFGLWKFAVKSYDEAGNAQAGALTEIERVVSARNPRPLSGFAFDSINAGRARFTVTG